jgi:hypothetical protein
MYFKTQPQGVNNSLVSEDLILLDDHSMVSETPRPEAVCVSVFIALAVIPKGSAARRYALYAVNLPVKTLVVVQKKLRRSSPLPHGYR